MKKLRCCVVDDEPLAAALIEKYVERTSFLEPAGVFSSCKDAAESVLSGGCDLLFLDIQMQGQTGMEFAKAVPESCRIIFTTAYERYAIDGFKVNAFDYLLKPIDYDDFLLTATRALRLFGKEETVASGCISSAGHEDKYLIVRSGYKMLRIKMSDIEIIEGLKDYVKICMAGSRNSIMALTSMKTVEQTLPPDQFMRVHRSYIVNARRISAIERGNISIGDHNIPVSDSYREQLYAFVASHTML